MPTVRITQLQRHAGGYYTADVSVDGADTVRVDTFTGAWTFPVDPSEPANARCMRRSVLTWCVELLNGRIAAAEGDAPAACEGRPDRGVVPRSPQRRMRYAHRPGTRSAA